MSTEAGKMPALLPTVPQASRLHRFVRASGPEKRRDAAATLTEGTSQQEPCAVYASIRLTPGGAGISFCNRSWAGGH